MTEVQHAQKVASLATREQIRARKISSACLIVDKLKINATHARSLNLLCFANEFFTTIDEGCDTAFVLRSREHNRDDAGNEYTTSPCIPSTNPLFRATSRGFMVAGD
jgi:hypothetical protein